MKIPLMFVLIAVFFVPTSAFASEIYLNPESNTVGPNDWIKVLINIDGYSGGDVSWSATKPDGTISEGKLSNLKASKATHTITRNAFDHQFGTWTIEYFYNDASASIQILVQELQSSVKLTKEKYLPGDAALIQFSSNYYEANSAYAGVVTLYIVDQNNKKINQFDDINFKMYQPQLTTQFAISDIVKYNPFGEYRLVATYFGMESSTTFEIIDPNASPTVFLGTDKSLYQKGDKVEINIGLNKFPSDGGVLRIIAPSGKEIASKIVDINNSMTRITFSENILNEIGTYTYEFDYAGKITKDHFDVLIESLDSPKLSDLDLGILVDKEQYMPGDKMLIRITTSKLIENDIIYWFEDPNGNQSEKFSYIHSIDTSFQIPHFLSVDTKSGSWKLFVKYGQAVESHAFFVESPSINDKKIFIPDWIKNNAKWWNRNQITDSEFAQGIEFMIKEKIIQIPDLKSGATDIDEIPEWIKNNAGWWSDGIISDQEFADSIEFLIANGIIRV